MCFCDKHTTHPERTTSVCDRLPSTIIASTNVQNGKKRKKKDCASVGNRHSSY